MVGFIEYDLDQIRVSTGLGVVGDANGKGSTESVAQTLTRLNVADGATANATDADLRDRTTHTGFQAIATVSGLQTALDAKADLVGGVIPTSQIPALAVMDFLGEVASESAMLLLTGQRGDWCNRTDLGVDYRLTADDATLLASWRPIDAPTSAVTTVNDQTGTVVLAAADVGAATVAQGALADTALQPGSIGITVQAFDADTAKTDADGQAWSGRNYSTVAEVAFSAVMSIDGDVAGPNKRKTTLTGNVTSFTLTNGTEGQSLIWYATQDATGGRTIVFSGIDGDEPTANTGADELTVYEFEFVSGTGWRFI